MSVRGLVTVVSVVTFLPSLGSLGGAQCQTGKLSRTEGPGQPLLDGDTLVLKKALYPSATSRAEVLRRSSGMWSTEAVFTVPTATTAYVDLSGDTLVWGSPGEDVGGFSSAGKAYVYQRTGGAWSFVQELFPTRLSDYAWFGSSVAIDGDSLAISQRFGTGYDRQVNVYARVGGTWSLEAEIVSTGSTSVVALQGDRLVVGSSDYSMPGEVVVFRREGMSWVEVQRLAPPTLYEGQFGMQVVTDGTRLAVASRLNVLAPLPLHLPRRWCVRVYEEVAGAFAEVVRFDAPTLMQSSFELSDGLLLVGDSSDADIGYDSGAIYVLGIVGGAWSLIDKLYGDDLRANNYLGSTLTADAGILASSGGDSVYLFGLVDPGCPRAEISADPVFGPAPLAVAFTDESIGPATDWTWSFGDGTSSNDQHPSHVYVHAGHYTVELLARNATGVSREIRRELVFAGELATAVAYNGTGVNPPLLSNLSLPRIGSTWSCEIDASSRPGALLATLQGRSRTIAGRPTAWGELLIDTRFPVLVSTVGALDATGRVRFDLPLPFDLHLVGRHVAVQGGLLGGGGQLLNAISLHIGF